MFEIEIKSLLGSKERANELKRRLAQLFPALKVLPSHMQRNHYFNVSSHAPQGIAATTNAAHANEEMKPLGLVFRTIAPLLPKEKQKELSHIIKHAKSGVSIRTREADGKVFFILKASIGDDSSANGVSRIEFECVIPHFADKVGDCGATNAAHANENKAQRTITLEELDKKLLDAGLVVQAKWSREREHYDLGVLHVTVDKNAGYGYLAEFEKMIDDGREAEYAKQELKALMTELGCQELPQKRLERMFKYYNEHWRDYYGTDRTFVIE